MSNVCDESLHSMYKSMNRNDGVPPSPIRLLELQRHPTTGLVHCVMTRTTTSAHLFRPEITKYLFSIQIPVKRGDQSLTALILTATKESGHSYSIYSTASETSDGRETKIGSITRVQINMYSISYVLKNDNDISIAYIVYRVPSPIKVLRDPPSRFVEVALHQAYSMSDGGDDRNDEYSFGKLNESLMSHFTKFDKLCLNSITNHHNLSGVFAVQVEDPAEIRVLQSIVPLINTSTGRVTLNFRGRGKYASPKNMQLIVTTSSHRTTPDIEKIHMQMCKWDNGTYHIDFDAPTISSLHAFAFGLAQVDL